VGTLDIPCTRDHAANIQRDDITLDRHEHIRREQTQESKRAVFIPAFGYSFLTPLFDFMMKWAARESMFKPKLVEQARIEKGHRVLDIGCGTGTLTILIKKANPEAEVIGLDADPAILEIAKSKVAEAGLDISLDCGMSFKLPYPDGSFDRVIASLVFHHLTWENRVSSFKEVFRVLRPGGELQIADLGKPQNALMYLPSLTIGRLEEASDFVKGLLPEMLRNAGFDQVEETAKYMTIFGTLALYRTRKPMDTLETARIRKTKHAKTRNQKLDEEK